MLKSIFNIAFAILVCLYIFACKQVDKKNVEAVTKYVSESENKLHKVKEIEKLKYSLTYRPTILMVEQELRGEKDEQAAKKAYAKYKPYYYFILNMSIDDKDALYKGSASQAQFSENIQKFSFQMGDYIYAYTNKDTIGLADFYTPNMYGYAKSTQVLLVFDRTQIKEEHFKINIEELGYGVGRQTFEFDKDDLEAIDN